MSEPLFLEDMAVGYSRKQPVLDGVTLSVRSGSITGLLGRNGVGKTTLIHTAIGLRRAWRGRALLFGHGAWNAPSDVRRRIGFVPQQFDDYGWLTPTQCIDLVGSFHSDWDAELVADLRERWSIPDQRIGTLSPGMRQCVAVLLAVGHRPDLLVLDEPVAMLDPSARRDFLRTIGDLNAATRQTVLLSSHICSDIERICSDVAILHNGAVALHIGIDDLKEHVRCVSGPIGTPTGGDVLARTDTRVWRRNWRAHDLSATVRVDEPLLEDLFLDVTS